MKRTISIPDDLDAKLQNHIKMRFGGNRVKALSLVIQEALMEYLNKHKPNI